MDQKVRLKDVAARLGVSTVTVSNALAGRKGVSRAVREKIRQTAREMGFDLSHYESKNVQSVKIGAIVLARPSSEENDFYADLSQKVRQAVTTRHAETELETIAGDDMEDPLPDIVQKGQIDGLLVLGKLQDVYLDRIIEEADFPVVLVNFCRTDLPCTSVLPNNYIGMYRAAQYGVDMGHRRIGFVGTGVPFENVRERYFGFLRCLKMNGLPLYRDWIFDGRDLDRKLFANIHDALPDLLVCAGDSAAVLVYEALEHRGMSVPADMSVVSFGNYLSGHPFGLRLTTYNVDRERMAQRSVELLLDQIGGAPVQRDPLYIDSVMIERSSVKDMR